jgi:transposase
MDGKLLLVTNVADLSPAEVVTRYKSLADVERGFRVLKSEIDIGPVFHRLPRIRAHASICFIALILYRVMRQRLTAACPRNAHWRICDGSSITRFACPRTANPSPASPS